MNSLSEPRKGSIGNQLGSLFQSGKHCDVTFIVGASKDRVQAHRIILAARSDVFYAMFFGSMIEANTNTEISITDIETPIFTKLLSFIYSDYVTVDPDDVLSMLYCAKKYDLPILVEICTQFFNDKYVTGMWDEETTFVVLEHAPLFDGTEVMEKAIQYIGSQADTHLVSPRVMCLPGDVMKKIVMNPCLNVKSEMAVINACVLWAENECKRNNLDFTPENKRKVLVDVLPHFRLAFISTDEIFSVIRPVGILNSEELLDLLEYKHLGGLSNGNASKFLAPNNMVRPLQSFGWWHVLMKAGAGQTFDYNSAYWTTDNVLNESDLSQEFKDAKFPAFNNLEIQELLIVAENKRYVHLKLPHKKTLLSCFTENQTITLEFIAGSRSPSILAGNDTNFRYYDPVWRIQSASTFHAMLRIGGWYQASWGQYGTDQGEYPCSAEWAGLGLLDKAWSPFVMAAKSFGIRSAHDSPNHGGNNSLGFILYGR